MLMGFEANIFEKTLIDKVRDKEKYKNRSEFLRKVILNYCEENDN